MSAWSPGASNSRGSARWRWPPWRNTRDRDDFAAYLDALLTGYRSIRAIDITHLDDFIALRQFAFQIWYTGNTQQNPAFAERLAGVERWSLDMLDLVEGAEPSA